MQSHRDNSNALRHFSEIQAQGLTPSDRAYATMILCSDAMGSDERWAAKKSKATPTLGAAGSLQPKAKGLDWLELMEKSGAQPSLATYNSAITQCARSLQMDAADTVFAKLADARIQPSLHSFGPMIKACYDARAIEDARKWLERLKKSGLGSDSYIVSHMLELMPDMKADRNMSAVDYLREMSMTGSLLVVRNLSLSSSFS